MLDQCAYRVPAGHRLRIAVSNAYWPMIWPSPEPVRLDLSAATLTLPLRPPATGDEVTLPRRPRRLALGNRNRPRRANSERHVDRDEKSGIVTLSIVNDFGEVRDLAHGLVNGSIARRPGRSILTILVGLGKTALDANPVAKWMVGAHRNIGRHALGCAELHRHRQN